jgi:hypothetical protein
MSLPKTSIGLILSFVLLFPAVSQGQQGKRSNANGQMEHSSGHTENSQPPQEAPMSGMDHGMADMMNDMHPHSFI